MKLIILVVVRELHRLRAVAIDGSKFRAVASIDSTRDRLALQRYLDSIEKAGEEQEEQESLRTLGIRTGELVNGEKRIYVHVMFSSRS